jgi:hypothetical protein
VRSFASCTRSRARGPQNFGHRRKSTFATQSAKNGSGFYFVQSTRRYCQVVLQDVESTGKVDTITRTVPEGSTPGLQRMNQGCNQSHIRVMTISHGDRRLADAPWTKQRDEPSLSYPVTNLGLRHLAANQHWGCAASLPRKLGLLLPLLLPSSSRTTGPTNE